MKNTHRFTVAVHSRKAQELSRLMGTRSYSPHFTQFFVTTPRGEHKRRSLPVPKAQVIKEWREERGL